MSDQTTDQPLVVVVDDDGVIRDLLDFVISEVGCEVHQCATGNEALAAVRDHRPALVLLDLGLPDISGLEVLSSLRAEGIEVPVIAMSGDPGEASESVRLGAAEFIDKPLDLDELAETVRSYLPQ